VAGTNLINEPNSTFS